MIRELKNEYYTLMYGTDHIEGLFYRIENSEGILVQSGSKMRTPILTINLIAALAEAYGFDLWNEVEEDVIKHE